MADVSGTGEKRSLPVEIVQLVHYLELNRSGWWDRALDRLVLVMAWLRAPLTAEQLATALAEALDERLETERVQTIIGRHIAGGSIVEGRDGVLKVAEEVATSLQAELVTVGAAEDRVRERLIELAAIGGIDADARELWDDFETEFMLPLVRDSGARMYEIITGTDKVDVALPNYAALITPLCEKYGSELRDILIEFLAPTDADVRSYVLRQLNAEFVRESAGLSSSVIAAIAKGRGRPDRVRVLIDTNFLFSFLKLHENPSNEVAEDLIELIERVNSTIKVELYVLSITVEETRYVLRDVMARLADVVPTRTLAGAAHQLSSSGLITRYLAAAAAHEGPRLTPEDFFGPYEANLLTVLRERNIEFFNEDIEPLRMDQAVIDDVLDQEKVQSRIRKSGPKAYEVNLHDMVLWHFADRKRPGAVDSPIDLGYWICTVDYGFIAFDRAKRRGLRKPPVCVPPSSLIQLLQFWAPRSDELDKALVGAIREPLLFLDFDRATEQATLKILAALSRFENLDDLSAHTVYNVLTNDALRARLESAPNATRTEAAEFVEGAVIEEARRMEAELVRLHDEKERLAKSAREELTSRTEEAEARLALTSAEFERKIAELEAERANLADQLDHERIERTREMDDLTSRLSTVETGAALRRDRSRLLATGAVAVVVAAIACVAGVWALSEAGVVSWIAWMLCSILAVLLIALLLEFKSGRLPALSGGRGHVALRSVRGWIIAAIGAVAASVLAAVIYEAQSAESSRELDTTTTTDGIPGE